MASLLDQFKKDPFDQFGRWYEREDLSGLVRFTYVLQRSIYSFLSGFAPELQRISDNAFTLSTLGARGPESRIVLLKSYDGKGFVFYSNYDSDKGRAIASNPSVQMLFYDSFPLRQIRIWGRAEKISRSDSVNYWNSRPRASQLSQAVSEQSQPRLTEGELLEKVKVLDESTKGKSISCPENWGGYRIVPNRFEYWLGRANRLHDRIVYEKTNVNSWERSLLQP